LEGCPPDRRWTMYATGLERGNSSIGYVAVSTLFVREHNRICGLLSREYGWSDDERLFQTARNINIVVLIKLLLEDYINHILGYPLFLFDPSFAERRHWYRQNWIALEFNLLYRWHGLVPGSMTLGGQSYDHWQFRNNNAFFEQQGLRKVVEAVSLQRAGRIGLGNTPKFLLPADSASLRMSRAFRLKPFNDYRERFGLRRLRSFEQLTTDKDLRATLTRLYPKGIDQLELIPGLFAESPQGNALFGKLMIAMVGYDALTQIYSNPLISEAVFTPETFTPRGMDVIRETTSIQSLVERNLSEAEKDGRGRVVASLSLR
ncbi:MAG TPA: peroxidase family protein, partial [Polyangia bacterium]